MLTAERLSSTVGAETEFASTYAALVHTFEAAQRRINPDPSPDEVAYWRLRPAQDRDDSQMFLGGLLQRVTRADRVYRHEWRVGDLVIWDNRGVLHRALPYDPTSERYMHRTTINGDEAIQ